MKTEFLLNTVAKDKYYPLNIVDAGQGLSKIPVPYSLSVSRGDTVEIKVDDISIKKGEVCQIDTERVKGRKTVVVRDYTRILWQKYVLDSNHQTYAAQDAGAIVKDLVDTYFSGILTSTNVDTTTGHTVNNIDGYELPVGDMIQDLADRAGCEFYVDNSKDVHFFVAGAEDSGLTINDSDVVDNGVKVSEKGDNISKVIVHGRKGVSGSAGSGYPEHLVRDRRISTANEANEIATALLSKLQSGFTQYIIQVRGFWSLRAKQKVTLDLTEVSGGKTVRKVSRQFAEKKVSTTIVAGDEQKSPAQVAMETIRQVLAQKDDYEPDHTELQGITSGQHHTKTGDNISTGTHGHSVGETKKYGRLILDGAYQTLYAASVSGGSPTTAFTAIDTGTWSQPNSGYLTLVEVLGGGAHNHGHTATPSWKLKNVHGTPRLTDLKWAKTKRGLAVKVTYNLDTGDRISDEAFYPWNCYPRKRFAKNVIIDLKVLWIALNEKDKLSPNKEEEEVRLDELIKLSEMDWEDEK